MRTISTWNFSPESELENYLQDFIKTSSICPWNIPKNNLSFVEGVTGVVINRKNQFQIEMFIVLPNVIIPEHIHPNIDSYEIAISGMTFIHSGITMMTSEGSCSGMSIYVDHSHWHGGYSSENGGFFLSAQQWLNGVQPTSVGNDWCGDTMGIKHNNSININ